MAMAICSRRMLLAAGALLLGGCAAVNLHPGDTRWIDAWGVSFLPTLRNGALDPVPTFDGQTLRVVVFSKLAGAKARVKLTNRFQTAQLQIGAARIALRDGARGGAIMAGTDRALSFDGQARRHARARRGTLERPGRTRGPSARLTWRSACSCRRLTTRPPLCMARVPRPASSPLRATIAAPSRCRRRRAATPLQWCSSSPDCRSRRLVAHPRHRRLRRLHHRRRGLRGGRQCLLARRALEATAIAARRHAGERDQHGHRLQSPGRLGQGGAGRREAFRRRRAGAAECQPRHRAGGHQRHQLRACLAGAADRCLPGPDRTCPRQEASRCMARRCCRFRNP